MITSCGDCMNFDTVITDIIFLPNSYVIPIGSDLEFQILTEEEVVTNIPRINLNLIQSAYATGCDDTYNPIKRIDNINVTSNQDFSSDYLSRSSLNELISVKYFNGSDMRNINTNLNDYIIFINQIGDGGKSNFNFESFSINQRPELSQQLSLRFEFTFTDGSNLIVETEPIEWE